MNYDACVSFVPSHRFRVRSPAYFCMLQRDAVVVGRQTQGGTRAGQHQRHMHRGVTSAQQRRPTTPPQITCTISLPQISNVRIWKGPGPSLLFQFDPNKSTETCSPGGIECTFGCPAQDWLCFSLPNIAPEPDRFLPKYRSFRADRLFCWSH